MSDPTQNGRTIRMFLVDGNANGVITAEIMNWTGHAVIGPRPKLPEILGRKEARRTGVYFLTGPDPDSGSPSVYIGESDDVGERLRIHASTKDFWEKVCFVTSKDQNLTKAHGRYLEGRLITLAKRAGRATLNNATNPDPGGLPEADISDMEYFIEQIRLVLPVLGMDFLRQISVPSASAAPETGKQSEEVFFVLKSRKHAIKAQAVERDDEFVVLKGSTAQPKWIGQGGPSGNESSSYGQLRAMLIKNGKIAPDSTGKTVFQDDVPFKSPSAASAVTLGRKSNGRKEWFVEGTKKTYADWQNEQLEARIKALADDGPEAET